jgi:hypothetical protein
MVKDSPPGDFSKASYLNLWMKYLQTGYSFKTISETSVDLQAARMFESDYPRVWWATLARNIYGAEAATKSEKEFFAIVDTKFQDAMRALESSDGSAAKPSSKTE